MNAAVETESCRARYDNRYPPPCGPGRVASESRPWPVQSESPVNARGRRARSRRPPPATGWGTYYSSETAGRRAAIFAAAAAQGSGPRDVAPRRVSGAGPSDVTCALARHAGPGAGPWSEIWRRFDGASLGPRRSGSRKTPEERNGPGRGDAAGRQRQCCVIPSPPFPPPGSAFPARAALSLQRTGGAVSVERGPEPGPARCPGTTHRRWEPAWHRVRPAHSAPGGHMGALPRQPGADGPGPGMRCEGAPAGTQASGPLVARGRPRRLGVGGPCRKRRTWGCDWDAAWARRPSCPA